MEPTDVKTYKDILELKEWVNNPRQITERNYDKLKIQLYEEKEETGEFLFKPLLIAEDGTVLGGNFRLKALRELGATKIWVSIVKAETEEKKLKYALKDNDRAGSYTENLANMTAQFPDIEWSNYSVDFGEPMSLDSLVNPILDESEIAEKVEEKKEESKEKKIITCPNCKFEFNQ